MWCKNCRQDTPGVPVAKRSSDAAADSPDAGAGAGPAEFSCGRCGQKIDTRTDADAAADVDRLAEHGIDLGGIDTETFRPDTYDLHLWELDEQLNEASRLLASGHGHPTPSQSSASAAQHGRRSKSPDSRRRRRARRPFMAWAILSLSLAAFTCGAVLVGWSQFGGRGDLWNLGLPLTLGSQAGLLVGLVLLLERVWMDSRTASEKLETVDDRLEDLRHTTTMLSTTHTTSAASFYSHLAEGASPHLLLADLKSQLDLLAVKLSDAER